ncbi:hypothetical protein ACQCX5_06730 [Propionibacteriaceae bacterium G57]
MFVDTTGGQGTNYTVNVAHPAGKVGAAVLLAVPVLLVAGLAVAALAG